MSDRGKYIVIEGVDGAGKTTISKRIVDELKKAGKSVTLTFEPGGTELGVLLRAIVFNPDIKMSVETIIDLISAARRETINQIVAPAVKKGDIVIADRCWYSTMAMQGFGSKADKDYIISRSKDATGEFYKPDCVVILDLDPETAQDRRTKRGITDRFKQEDLDYFKRVREGYGWIAKNYDATVIDASQPIETVEKLIMDAIRSTVGL